ncbi:MAG: L,D-transpeptidase [Myxococcota bacterium]
MHRLLVLLMLSACGPKESTEPSPEPIAPPPEAVVPLPEPEPIAAPEPEPEPDREPLFFEVDPEGREVRVANRRLNVYRAAKASGRRRAVIEKHYPFAIERRVDGPGCSEGWAALPGGGFVCLNHTETTTEPLRVSPPLVAFVHPGPDDWESYSTEGVYNKDPDKTEVPGLVPYVYAKVWRKWKGPVYKSAESFAAGDSPISRMAYGMKFRFTEVIETDAGTVLERPNGTVIPVDEIFLYPLTDFHGREVDREPIPEGMQVAWVFGYDGGNVRPSPDLNAEVAEVLPYHTELMVRDAPVDEAGHWWEIPDALGPGVSGYVNDQRDIRHWVPRTPPDEVTPGEVWVDVDLGQQVLALREGDDVLFVTMVSTGDVGWATPQGIFRIYDKMIETTMASRAGVEEEDVYYVEGVPWTMHFKPRYALHGTFWHWGFGHRASHGCVNLSPRDARYVFDRVGPTMEAGWHSVFETPDDVGTVVRIRNGDRPVRDRRASLY